LPASSLLDHRYHLTLIGYVTVDGECLVACGNKFFGWGRSDASWLSASATDAPALAKAFAAVRPMPEPAPVTSATFLSKTSS
jgi:hypothetical protein